MRKSMIVGLATMFMMVGCSDEQAKIEKPEVVAPVIAQSICPVMGGKIDKNQFVDVNGYRIYICCAGCKAKIVAEPAKFIKKLKDSGVTLDKTP